LQREKMAARREIETIEADYKHKLRMKEIQVQQLQENHSSREAQ
jgi:hypothetical protein